MSRRLRGALGLGLPIAVTALSRIDAFRSSEASILGIEITRIADALAPAYLLTFVVAAGMAARAVTRDARQPPWWATVSVRLVPIAAALTAGATWLRSGGSLAGDGGATLLAALAISTAALLLAPIAWMREGAAEAVTATFLDSRPSRRIIAFLFHPRADGRSVRWTHAAALAAITLVAAFLARGELGSLLAGMHPADRPPATVSALSDTWNFDLGSKREAIEEATATWSEYREAVGEGFTSPGTIVGWHAMVTLIGLIPGYTALVGIAVLALLARARGVGAGGLEEVSDERAERLRVMGGLALAVLAGIALTHAAERLLAWNLAMRGLEGDAIGLGSAQALWALAVARRVATALLAVFLVTTYAGRVLRLRRPLGDVFIRPPAPDFRSVIALRAGILILLVILAALFIPVQMADVARRWTTSNTLAAVLLASVLAMMLEHHGSSILRVRARHAERTQAGDPPEPTTIRLGRRTVGLSRVAVEMLVALAALQIAIDIAGIPVGRGLIVPVLIVGVVWLLGVPLAPARFERWETPSPTAIAIGPRLVGSLVFVLLGAGVLKASIGHLAYSGRVDGWIALVIVPPIVGTWRLASRRPEQAGVVETSMAVVLVGAGAWLAIGSNPQLTPSALTVTGLFLVYGAIPFFFSFTAESLPARVVRWTRSRLARLRPIRALLLLSPLALAAALIANPIRLPQSIGAHAAMLLFAVLVFAVIATGVRYAEATRPPRLVAMLRIRRTPVIAFGAIWLALTPMITTPGAHDIRVVTSDAGPAQRVGIDAVWDRYAARTIDRTVEPVPDGRPAVPLLLVSSSGGGTRAAVWTSYVLDCVFAAEPIAGDEACPGAGGVWRSPEPIAAVAAVSGGGLGLASFFVHGLEADGSGDWVGRTLGDDYLSPAFSWLALVDIPRGLLGFSSDVPDRAEILERAWEASWTTEPGLELGLRQAWEEHPELPAMVFAAASVVDACRFNTSVIDGAIEVPGAPCTSLAPFDANRVGLDGGGFLPTTHDLVDHLCPDEDVRLSTAVLNGARFPVLSPLGRIAGTGDCETPDPVFVADGGYFEGSSAATILDVYEALAPFVERHNATSDVCVVPFLIHIDNGYEGGFRAAKGEPRELTSVITTLNAARVAWVASVRVEAALAFDTALTVGGDEIRVVAIDETGRERTLSSRYARLTTRSHPGVQAPLGWSLSQASIDDLRLQLQTTENSGELTEIFGWLDGRLECRSGG